MSTLYLHCGYHKTGSSFLQTMFVRNRELLQQASIWHPYSLEELEMQRGLNTHGNGKEFMDTLSSIDTGQTIELLKNDLHDAKKSNCDSVLYSSEGLFHVFPKDGALKNLAESAVKSGFQKIKALIYFRDPVSHALSTYKHRSKRGDHSDFEEWIANRYETMGLLGSFCSYQTKYEFEWSCRKYRPDSDFMACSAFVDWLDTEMPNIPEDDRVNSSLNLSEICVLQGVKGVYDAAIPHLYNEFIALAKYEKSRNRELDDYFTETASKILSKQNELVQCVNRFLPAGEKLEIAAPNRISDDIRFKPDIRLKPGQMTAIARAMKKTAEAERISAKTVDLWNRGTRKILRILKASGY